MNKILHFVLCSPILNSWLSNIISIISSLIAIPIVITKLSLEEINLWFLLTTITVMAQGTISGINATFVRFVAYSSAGVKIKDFQNIKSNKIKKKQVNVDVLELSKIFFFMKTTYLGIAGIYTVLLLLLGYFVLNNHILLIEKQLLGWLSWSFVFITIIVTFIFGYFQVFLEGVNKVALVQRTRAVINLLGLPFILLVLFIYPNLLSIVMVYQLIALSLVGSLVYFGLKEAKKQSIKKVNQDKDATLKHVVWESAWKSGFTSILASIVKHVSALLVAQLFSTAQSASFLLVKRFFDVIEGFATTTFYARVPFMAKLRGQSDFNKLLPMLRQTQYISFGVFIVGYSAFLVFGELILELIHSKVGLGNAGFIILFSFSSLMSRYSGISMAIANQANHIVEHINTGIISIVYFAIIYYFYNELGVNVFPFSQIIAAGFAMLFVYKAVYNSLHTTFFAYESKVMFPVLGLLSIINIVYFWISK